MGHDGALARAALTCVRQAMGTLFRRFGIALFSHDSIRETQGFVDRVSQPPVPLTTEPLPQVGDA